MNRRDFLKYGMTAGGILVAGSALALPHRKRSPILGGSKGVGGTTPDTWTTWNETNEAGWGDSSNTYICLFENAAAGNEVGQGGGLVNAADLTLTQSGTVPGSSGTPKRRRLDGADDKFDIAQAASDILKGTDTWTVIVKAAFVTNTPVGAFQEALFHFRNDVTNDYLWVRLAMDGSLEGYVNDGGAIRIAGSTTDKIAAGTVYYIVAQCNGASGCVIGYSATKPTKTTDFVAAKKLSSLAVATNFAGAFSGREIGYDLSTLEYLNVDLYYIIISKSALLS